MPHLLSQLTRRKVVRYGDSELRRVLGILDLTMLGVGIYVLAGQVSRTSAGPAIVISFLIAAVASLFAVALALGVKESSRMNNIFTGINIIIIIFVIIDAGTKANPYNWNIPAAKIDKCCNTTDNFEVEGDDKWWGEGGFAPYGFQGIMEGAATCFFGFVGFDIITTTGFVMYFCYGTSNSSLEYRMQGRKVPNSTQAEMIGTLFNSDSDSEDEILYNKNETPH